jgi:hypothetical protein
MTRMCGRLTIGSHSYRRVANEPRAHYLTAGRTGSNGTHHGTVEDPLTVLHQAPHSAMKTPPFTAQKSQCRKFGR